MTFTPEQTTELGAALDKQKVSTRKQAGVTLSYIEGWWAISEANRIFGFDGWTRETVGLTMVSEREREVGKQKLPGWGVTYTAKVRIEAGGIVREGCGAGHGIDKDCGQAHESAVKEAETDAMKRALMTFGNPFGLALYDKTQTNVVDGGWLGPMNKSNLSKTLKAFAADVQACDDLDTLDVLISTSSAIIEQCKVDLPAWWEGNAHLGGDSRGLEIMINERRMELEGAGA